MGRCFYGTLGLWLNSILHLWFESHFPCIKNNKNTWKLLQLKKVGDQISILFYILGKAREKLKWADGKAIKSEIDMQVKLCPAVPFELQ